MPYPLVTGYTGVINRNDVPFVGTITITLAGDLIPLYFDAAGKIEAPNPIPTTSAGTLPGAIYCAGGTYDITLAGNYAAVENAVVSGFADDFVVALPLFSDVQLYGGAPLNGVVRIYLPGSFSRTFAIPSENDLEPDTASEFPVVDGIVTPMYRFYDEAFNAVLATSSGVVIQTVEVPVLVLGD